MQRSWAYLFAAALATALWIVYYPALLSNDSLHQFAQALSGRFDDWHPLLPALVLHAVMGAGGGIGTLTLLQALAGSLGIVGLATVVIGARIGRPAAASAGGALILLLLLTPLFPLSFILVTFWKDTWLAIALLWVAGLGLRLARPGGRGLPPVAAAALAGLLLASFVALRVRHNAVCLAPALVLLAWAALRLRGLPRGAALGLACLPLAASLAFGAAERRVWHVERRHAERQIALLDTVGMMIRRPSLTNDCPFIAANLSPDYAQRYRPGDVVPLLLSEPRIVRPAATRPAAYPVVWREYRRAVAAHPVTWLAVKWAAWRYLLSPAPTPYWFHRGIDLNPLGLAPNTAFAGVRAGRLARADAVAGHPVLRWVGAVHLPWLLAAVASFALALWRLARQRRREDAVSAAVWAFPVLYALSFLAASPAADFRYLFPATLLTQVLLLSQAAARAFSATGGHPPPREADVTAAVPAGLR